MKQISGFVLVLMLGALVRPYQAAGQIVYGQRASGNVQMMMTSWTSTYDGSDTKLSQTLVPFTGFLPVKENLEARVYAATVSNDLDFGPVDYSLSGLTDMRLLLSGSLNEDKILLSIGANLPTGKAELDTIGDYEIMNYLSYDFLSLPNRRLGAGFGFNAMAGYATMAGKYKVGGSVTYRYAGSYQAYVGDEQYDPGDQVSFYAGIQETKKSFFWKSGFTYSTFGTNSNETRAIYDRGDEASANLRIGNRYDKSLLSGGVSYYYRGDSKIYDADNIHVSELQLYGNEVNFSGEFKIHTLDKVWQYGPLMELRYISAGDRGLGDANTLSLGGLCERKISDQYKLGIVVRYYNGSADGGGIDLEGYQFMTSLSGVF